MSKRKLRNVPAGPRVSVLGMMDAILNAAKREPLLPTPEVLARTEHQAKLRFRHVDKRYSLDELLCNLKKIHQHCWDYVLDDSVTSHTGQVYVGKGIVAEIDRYVTVLDGDSDEQTAVIEVQLKSCAVGRERSMAYNLYATWVEGSAWPVVSAESAPVLLTMLANELAKKENREALRNAVPAIKKTAILLKIAV